ncbi:DUF4760 domain-containing protein [Nodosilinea nodulosa]|uniref:DUF4760 domain-containing protein n=1 Tax=Nodosilinea nodulosa TaxID=416001 RepID=UPI00037BF3D4|nr:DUF4760 domain-containing protein [Nodosilinea nodulosa]
MKNKMHGYNIALLPGKPGPKNRFLRFYRHVERKIHLDKNVWNFLIIFFMLFSVAIAWRHPGLTNEQRDSLISTAAIIGAAGALVWTANGIHNQYHACLLSRASNYVQAWYSDDLANSLKVIRGLVGNEFDSVYDGQINNIDDFDINPVLSFKYGELELLEKLSEAQLRIAKKIMSDKELEGHVEKVACFFEQMGQDVKFGLVDTEYLKDFFYVIVVKYYELLRKYIEYWQDYHRSLYVYCNFVYLAQTWEKQEYPPKIPTICLRKSILSKKDCRRIGKRKLIDFGFLRKLFGQ